MHEEHVVATPELILYLIGYVGLLIRVLLYAKQKGTNIGVLIEWVKENSLMLVSTIVTYNAVVAMWYFSNLFEWAGFFQGELTGATILVGFSAEQLFKEGTKGLQEKIKTRKITQEKLSQNEN